LLKIHIIGSGIGGLSAAIRLAAAGHTVTIYEKNAYPGGKLSELCLGGYRFDKGPSLLTLPELIDELTKISGFPKAFLYKKLDTLTHYFYEDGTFLKADADIHLFSEHLNKSLGEKPKSVKDHLRRSALFYELTADIFLKRSLHRYNNFFTWQVIRGLINSWRLKLFTTMNQANQTQFENPKTVQLFNRYATYNGSNPYKAPALLNIIPHLEFNSGAYLPDGGMHDITKHLVACAEYLGVTFIYNTAVNSIALEKNKAIGIHTAQGFQKADIVVSDIDMHVVYNKFLPNTFAPKRLLNQEKSSSAYIFYWGIKSNFPQLDVHNILFSDNYKEEFDTLFSKDSPYHDLTVYINITSKHCRQDAPAGCENWFVMVNVPHNASQKPITYAKILRQYVIQKINRVLKTNIEAFIEVEETLDPHGIEIQTSSFGGSLYGNSSNNRFSAFLRHANYRSKIKHLYFCGGSVHPGGGIPLCILSGKIVSEWIESDKKNH
jgi:phytoene desaturase